MRNKERLGSMQMRNLFFFLIFITNHERYSSGNIFDLSFCKLPTNSNSPRIFRWRTLLRICVVVVVVFGEPSENNLARSKSHWNEFMSLSKRHGEPHVCELHPKLKLQRTLAYRPAVRDRESMTGRACVGIQWAQLTRYLIAVAAARSKH